MNNKLIRDGKVAIVISPSFGAGLSTWNDEIDPTDETLALMVLDETKEEDIGKYLKELYPEAYLGGVRDGLKVEWVPQGKRYMIHEYDGSEQVWIADENFGKIA